MIYQTAQPGFIENFLKPAVKQSPTFDADYYYNLGKGAINFLGDHEDSPMLMVDAIEKDLKENYDFNVGERDALRHYLGMQAFAEVYGPEVADFFGKWHEGDYFSDKQDIQGEIDLKNNAKALEDFKANRQLKQYDQSILDSLLKHLIIPPTPAGFDEFEEEFESFNFNGF